MPEPDGRSGRGGGTTYARCPSRVARGAQGALTTAGGARALAATWARADCLAGGRRLATDSFLTVPVHNLDPVPRLAQQLAHVLGDHDRAMLPAGATEADGEVALPFAHVVGQKIDQQLRDAVDKLLGLGEGADVPCDLGMAPGKGAEFWDEMRVGQETHVEYEVGILGHAVLNAEAHA